MEIVLVGHLALDLGLMIVEVSQRRVNLNEGESWVGLHDPGGAHPQSHAPFRNVLDLDAMAENMRLAAAIAFARRYTP